MPKPNRNEIDDLNEWQEHQYNPGYWVNRLPAGFPPKRSKGWFIIGLIQAILIVPAFIILLVDYTFNNRPSNYLVATIILGVFSILIVLYAFSQRPLKRGKALTQAEMDEIRRKEEKGPAKTKEGL